MPKKDIAELLTKSKELKKVGSLRNHQQYPALINMTNFLTGNVTPLQRLWHVSNDVYNIPCCVVCNGPTAWNKMKGGSYRDCCSNRCATANPLRKDKIKTTNLKVHGGVSPMSNAAVKQKIKNTNTERYGVDHPWKSKKVQHNIKKTMIERYGVEHALQSEQIKSKFKQTCVDRYGCDNPRKSPTTKNKIKSTNQQRYGVDYFNQTKLSADTLSTLSNKKWMVDAYVTHQMSSESISDMLECDPSTVLKYIHYHNIPISPNHRSSGEIQLSTYINSLAITTITNTTSVIPPHELDIYIPSHKIAIEFNGVYWHSELQNKTKNYHLSKTQRCLDQDIQLIHISNNDWNDKRDIIQNRLQHKLSSASISPIYARKCVVEEISPSTTKTFITTHHIQGPRPATTHLGLYHNNTLVMVMSISKHKKWEWEIIRMCSLFGVSVVGGAGKLFKYFISVHKPNAVLSYADRSWGEGLVYQHMGFTHNGNTPPNYRYFHTKDPSKTYSRLQFQKHKLEGVLDVYDHQLTEWENMVLNGYDRIWDCGSARWLWTVS